jgi:phage shock protein A
VSKLASGLFWKLFGSEWEARLRQVGRRVEETARQSDEALRNIAALRQQVEGFERRLEDVATGHEQLARSAQQHLAGLQAEFERFERRLGELTTGHEQLARGAREHLASLQAGSDRMGIAQHYLDGQVSALRAALPALEACLADLERSQGWLSVAITRGGLDKIPE